MRDPRDLECFELERIVAVEVLGWTPSDPNNHYCDWRLPDGGWLGCWSFKDENLVDSWDGMAKVIDALRARGLYVDIRTCADFFEVSVTDANHIVIVVSADPSAPRAVALAAISAIRSTKGGA